MSALTYAGVNLAVLVERLLSIAQQYQGGSGDLGQSFSHRANEDVVIADHAPDRGIQGYGSKTGLPICTFFGNEVDDLSESADCGCKCLCVAAAHDSSLSVVTSAPTVSGMTANSGGLPGGSGQPPADPPALLMSVTHSKRRGPNLPPS